MQHVYESSVAAIVGATIGGALIVLLGVFLILWYLRSRRRVNARQKQVHDSEEEAQCIPLSSTSPSMAETTLSTNRSFDRSRGDHPQGEAGQTTQFSVLSIPDPAAAEARALQARAFAKATGRPELHQRGGAATPGTSSEVDLHTQMSALRRDMMRVQADLDVARERSDAPPAYGPGA
jgi:hypothetical protein